MKKNCLILIFILSLSSCEKYFLEEDPENNPITNFEIFWKTFDKYYSMFEIKKVDWDSIYNIYKPLVSDTTSESGLFRIFEKMIFSLRDGHLYVCSSQGLYTYFDYSKGYPGNHPSGLSDYIHTVYNFKDVFVYGKLKEGNLGYIRIKTFEGGTRLVNIDNRYNEIDNILDYLKATDGLVIDVRDNSGGNPTNAENIASRFTDQQRLYSYYKFRTGPKRDDYSKWIECFIHPLGENTYTKPIVILTNRNSFSAAEAFILMMREIPGVRTIGGLTGGGSGNPVPQELPNGFSYRVSTWVRTDKNFNCFDGIGLLPDIQINISSQDSIDGKDTILEEAILKLLSK